MAGRTYTTPLFSDWDFSELQAQCSIEELDRRLSTDAEIRVFYNPQDPQKARVDYTSLPAVIQQMLENVSSQKT